MERPKYVIKEIGGSVPDQDVIVDLTRLHTELLAHSPVVLMGPEFMRGFYYKTLPSEGRICGAIAYVDDRAAGFIVATDDPERFMSRALKKHFLRIAYISLKSVVKNPARILAMKEAYEVQANVQAQEYGPDVGELLSFGVLPEFRSRKFVNEFGLQISSDLLAASVSQLVERQKRTIRAIIDKDNIEAQFFYRANGWRVGLTDVEGWRVPSVEFLLDVK